MNIDYSSSRHSLKNGMASEPLAIYESLSQVVADISAAFEQLDSVYLQPHRQEGTERTRPSITEVFANTRYRLLAERATGVLRDYGRASFMHLSAHPEAGDFNALLTEMLDYNTYMHYIKDFSLPRIRKLLLVRENEHVGDNFKFAFELNAIHLTPDVESHECTTVTGTGALVFGSKEHPIPELSVWRQRDGIYYHLGYYFTDQEFSVNAANYLFDDTVKNLRKAWKEKLEKEGLALKIEGSAVWDWHNKWKESKWTPEIIHGEWRIVPTQQGFLMFKNGMVIVAVVPGKKPVIQINATGGVAYTGISNEFCTNEAMGVLINAISNI